MTDCAALYLMSWTESHPLARFIFLSIGYATGSNCCSLLSKGGDIRYISKYTVKMRVGGKSNTLKNMKLKMKEDLMALRVNNIGGYYALFMKSLSKVSQFFNN